VRVSVKDGEPDAVLEISPLYATSAAQLHARDVAAQLPHVPPGASIYLGSRGTVGD
jgi:hypothetical protein